MTLERPVELNKANGAVTFEEYLARLGEGTHAELEDGEIIFMSPASRRHQRIFGWLYSILKYHTRHFSSGELLLAPFSVRLHKTGQVREPDILFVRTENLTRIVETYVDGPPDLVVEIVSPESIDRDRGRKFVEYEAEGISEYWLIDPIREQAEFYRLGKDRRYHQALPDADGIFRSESVPGFWLRVAWMWQDPLPNELEILREFGLLS